jgi:hypothetical protein
MNGVFSPIEVSEWSSKQEWNFTIHLLYQSYRKFPKTPTSNTLEARQALDDIKTFAFCSAASRLGFPGVKRPNGKRWLANSIIRNRLT